MHREASFLGHLLRISSWLAQNHVPVFLIGLHLQKQVISVILPLYGKVGFGEAEERTHLKGVEGIVLRWSLQKDPNGSFIFKRDWWGGGTIVQRLRTYILFQDPIATNYNSSSRESITLFWLLRGPVLTWTHIHIIKNKRKHFRIWTYMTLRLTGHHRWMSPGDERFPYECFIKEIKT